MHPTLRRFSFFLCAPWLFWSAFSLPTLSEAAIELFPDGRTVNNPRLPIVNPVEGGERGHFMDVSARFTYSFSPFLSFENGGKLDLWMRDTPQRLEKKVFWLKGEGSRVGVVIAPASEGRTVSLQMREGESVVDRMEVASSWGEDWRQLGFRWTDEQLSVLIDGAEQGSVEFKKGFSPQQIEFDCLYLDDISLEGEGSFSLDWENGYAAEVDPAENATAAVLRAFGFDSFVISLDPESREFPMMQVSKAGEQSAEATIQFQLKGERSGLTMDWSQSLSVGGSESAMEPIQFPKSLVSDVYHLKITEVGTESGFSDEKHFFYVEPREDLPGPSKFGLHDSNNRTFGSWPDPLGIDFAHAYSYWSYIVGPAWIRDYDGEYGLDPDTPAEEWAWNPRVDWHIGHGLKVYLSLQSEPFQDWMRAYEYPEQRMKEYPWGIRGGFPKMDLYRDFVHEAAKRYQGKVEYYEIENEPNAGGKNQIPPKA